MIHPRGSRTIAVDIYTIDVLLLLNETQIKSFVKLNNLDKEDVLTRVEGWYCTYTRASDGVKSFVIGILRHDLGVLVHECVHMAHCIMDCVQVPIGIKNTEAEAYLVGYLFDEARKYIKEKK